MTTSSSEVQHLISAEWHRADPGPVWSRWLGAARPDGPGLRRWALWIWWTRPRSAWMRVVIACTFVRGFMEAPLEVLAGLRRFGGKTAKVHGVSRAKQFRHLLALRWRFGVRPKAYYKFQMFKPERLHNAPHFVEEIGQLLQVLCSRLPSTPDDRLFLSKEGFRRWCLLHGLPTPQNLIEVDGGAVVARFAEALPAVDLFVKPTNWRCGRGASRWHCVGSKADHRYTDGSGRELSPAEFEEFVCRTSLEQGRPYIVQPVLTNHPALRGFTNGALATVRLMTVRGTGQQARPLMAALRMPTGGAIADNFDAGGVAAPIDLRTGACGSGLRKKDQYPPDTVDAHPDTGDVIAGHTVPCWAECVALACRAHDLIQTQVPVIGWDVAVLETGPVLVEPNHLPCENLAQMPAGFPLGASEFAEIVVSQLRQSFLSDGLNARTMAIDPIRWLNFDRSHQPKNYSNN